LRAAERRPDWRPRVLSESGRSDRSRALRRALAGAGATLFRAGLAGAGGRGAADQPRGRQASRVSSAARPMLRAGGDAASRLAWILGRRIGLAANRRILRGAGRGSARGLAMHDLAFAVETAVPTRFAAAPTLSLKLRITSAAPPEQSVSIALR